VIKNDSVPLNENLGALYMFLVAIAAMIEISLYGDSASMIVWQNGML
jgi:hypothetical protein